MPNLQVSRSSLHSIKPENFLEPVLTCKCLSHQLDFSCNIWVPWDFKIMIEFYERLVLAGIWGRMCLLCSAGEAASNNLGGHKIRVYSCLQNLNSSSRGIRKYFALIAKLISTFLNFWDSLTFIKSILVWICFCPDSAYLISWCMINVQCLFVRSQKKGFQVQLSKDELVRVR